jgi:hypothetical protein
MVGIARKVKQITNLVRKYAPVVDNFIPGFSTVANTAIDVGEGLYDGITNVYDDYQTSKKKGSSYGLKDGIKSFMRPGAFRSLTKDYGGVNPRLGLGKGVVEEDDEGDDFKDDANAANPY